MTQSSEATISTVFLAWAVFLSTLFECLDLSPLPGFVEVFLPKVFKDPGFVEAEALGDATETWSHSPRILMSIILLSATTRTTLLVKQQCGFTLIGGLLCCSETETSLSDVGF